MIELLKGFPDNVVALACHGHVSREDYDKVLVCVSGSITFHTPDGDVALEAGGRLDLAAGTPHAATVGPDGVDCLEAVRW